MRTIGQEFEKGDWIVHLIHGVGQVRGIEKKLIEGEAIKYYRVKAHNSTWWVPVELPANNRIRPLASRRQLKEALKAFQRPPQEMISNHTKRISWIKEVKAEGSLKSICRLVRDLSVRERKNKISQSEQQVLQQLEDHLIHEWAVCLDCEVEEVRQELNNLIQQSMSLPKAVE